MRKPFFKAVVAGMASVEMCIRDRTCPIHRNSSWKRVVMPDAPVDRMVFWESRKCPQGSRETGAACLSSARVVRLSLIHISSFSSAGNTSRPSDTTTSHQHPSCPIHGAGGFFSFILGSVLHEERKEMCIRDRLTTSFIAF